MHRKMSSNKGLEFVGNEYFGHGIGPARNRPSMLMPRPCLRTAGFDPKPTFVRYLTYNTNKIVLQIADFFRCYRYRRSPADQPKFLLGNAFDAGSITTLLNREKRNCRQ